MLACALTTELAPRYPTPPRGKIRSADSLHSTTSIPSLPSHTIDAYATASGSAGPGDDESITSGSASGGCGQGQSVVDSYDRKKKKQEELANGILKFNLSPKKGLAFLEKSGHLKSPVGEIV